MARWALIPVVMAFATASLLLAQAQQQQASITGIVRDAATRRPVVRAVVTASGPKRLPSVLTDTSGRFAFDGLDPGSYGLGVAKGLDGGSYGRRWVGGQGVQLPLTAGQRQEVEVLLWPYGSIAGTAYDERNAPLADVTVTVIRIDDGGTGQRAFSTGSRTDDRGMFEVGRLPPGRYAVCVGIAHRTTYPEFDVPMVVRSSMFRDVRGPGGQILALSDEPLPLAADTAGHRQTYVTTCSPSSKGLRDATEVSLQLGEQRTGVDVHMRTERQFRVSGRIVQPQENPGDIDLSLVPVDSPTPGLDRFIPTSASKGERFLFMSVPAGEYILKARRNTGHSDVIIRDERGLWSEQRIDVGDIDVVDVLVEMKLGGTISGRFVCEDDPAARCWRGAPTFVEESFMGGGAVAQDGSFTITGVRPGSYRIDLASYNVGTGWRLKSITHKGRDVTNVPIAVDAVDVGDLVVTMTKQRTVVGGIVRDGLSPTTDTVVVVFPEDANRWPRPRTDQLFRTVSPSLDGRYEILDLPSGSYLVAAVRGPELNAWPSVATLQSLRSAASRVQVAFGQPASLDLQVRAR